MNWLFPSLRGYQRLWTGHRARGLDRHARRGRDLTARRRGDQSRDVAAVEERKRARADRERRRVRVAKMREKVGELADRVTRSALDPEQLRQLLDRHEDRQSGHEPCHHGQRQESRPVTGCRLVPKIAYAASVASSVQSPASGGRPASPAYAIASGTSNPQTVAPAIASERRKLLSYAGSRPGSADSARPGRPSYRPCVGIHACHAGSGRRRVRLRVTGHGVVGLSRPCLPNAMRAVAEPASAKQTERPVCRAAREGRGGRYQPFWPMAHPSMAP